jgi:viologen exporter family transport system ATP-binding protein
MIEIEHLTKRYRVARKAAGFGASLRGLFVRQYEEVLAVSDISFKIAAGERVGFLGPNGAGKTTTLKMLAGLLVPTSGRISVLGMTPQGRPPALLKQITLVMGQKQQLLWDLPPIETLELNRAVYEIDRAEYQKTLADLTAMLGLEGLLDKPTRQLSLGERMKCELAAALLHRPRVLFLDEPTIGLDVTMQAVVRKFIKEYNERTGATVLLTSHYMDDVTALCPRVIVIDRGRLKYDGDLERLMKDTNPDKLISVTLSRPVTDEDLRALAIDGGPVRIASRSEAMITLLSPPQQITETVRMLLRTIPVADLKVEDPPIEDIMRQVFGA